MNLKIKNKIMFKNKYDEKMSSDKTRESEVEREDS